MGSDSELIRSIDGYIRFDLESIREDCFWWLLFSSGLVIAGVILEGPEILHEIRGILRSWFRAGVPVTSRQENASWIKILGLVGWVLVVLGVVGEGISEAFVSKADGILQTFNDISLADAIRRASSAEVIAKTFDLRIAAANAVAKGAEARSLAARVEYEKLRKENLVLQSDILRLRKSSEPRRLTGEQKSTLIRLLKGRPTPIAVVSRLLDTESSDFADDFTSALTDARWTSVRIRNHITAKYGVSIGAVSPDIIAAQEFKLLDGALTTIGISHNVLTFKDGEASTSPSFQLHVLYLVIEEKPPLSISPAVK